MLSSADVDPQVRPVRTHRHQIGSPVEPQSPPTGAGESLRTSPWMRRVPLVLVAGLVAIFLDIWLGGPLRTLDLWLARSSITEASALHGPASLVDRIGLRGVTAPLLVAYALWLRRSTGRWVPLLLTSLSLLLVNVVVGSLKITVGRGRPATATPDLFVGDMMWPSGHAANVALTAALVVYLMGTYGQRQLGLAIQATVVLVPSMVMASVSVALGYHWLSDLLAGSLVGLGVAVVVARIDAWSLS